VPVIEVVMSENAIRVDRIKKILGVETDIGLAELCGTYHSRVSSWRTRGLTPPIERLLDLLLDKYDQDKRPRIGRPPKLPVGQRIREARKARGLSQRDLAEMMYGAEGFSDNALRMRGSRLERSETIDDEELGRVAQALGIPKEEL
jgi:hypothetical protein